MGTFGWTVREDFPETLKGRSSSHLPAEETNLTLLRDSAKTSSKVPFNLTPALPDAPLHLLQASN